MNSKEKAVRILNNIGRECTYNKEKDDIAIWDNTHKKINLYFKGNIFGENKKFSFSISSSNCNLTKQKELHEKVGALIYALEKIKRIDPSLVG